MDAERATRLSRAALGLLLGALWLPACSGGVALDLDSNLLTPDLNDPSVVVDGNGATDGNASSGRNPNAASSSTDVFFADNRATTSVPVDWGSNVLMFDPSMSQATMQSKLDQLYDAQDSAEFGSARYALLFRPGSYDLDVQVGFYTTAHGLGRSPDAVNIRGAVRSKATWFQGNATHNFWRGAENLAVTPTEDNGVNVWAVSQATWFRRMHVKGKMVLSDNGWSSGGFIADSAFDGQVDSGTQQQFLLRNTALNGWTGGAWNQVFLGTTGAPANNWPSQPYSNVTQTPMLREKPYLSTDATGKVVVVVPANKTSSRGTSWKAGGDDGARVLSIDHFYVAHAGTDTAATLNAALAKGLNLLFTPGIYKLSAPLNVSRRNTTLLGLGLATLLPTAGKEAVVVADVDGVNLAGLLLDAGATESSSLLVLGTANSVVSHANNPTTLWDISCRVGGAAAGKARNCLTVHSNDVVMDQIWLWRADHGSGVGWSTNTSANGLTVNGRNVKAYGLFVEHFQNYQTLWNADGGQVIFYQSEIPYDVPNQGSWTHDGQNGFASYRVSPLVKHHSAIGLGVYCVFFNAVSLTNAIETPALGGNMNLSHMITLWLGQDDNSAIEHVINGSGSSVNKNHRSERTSY